MLLFFKYWTLFWSFTFQYCFLANCQNLEPTIKVINLSVDKPWANDWNVNLENGEIIAKHRNALVLTLKCTATFPIKFYIDTARFRKFPENMRLCESPLEFNGSFYSRTSNFHFLPNVTSAVEIVRCNQAHGRGNTSVNIFVPGEKALLHSGSTLTYKDNDKKIRCPSTNPRVSVSLFMQLNKNDNLNLRKVNATYDPVQGFYFKREIDSTYVCSAGRDDNVYFVSEETMALRGTTEKSSLAEDNPPEITHLVMNGLWDRINIQNEAVNFVAMKNDDIVLNLKCSAPYDIEWAEEFQNKRLTEVSNCDSFPELVKGRLIYSRRLTLGWKNVTKLLVTTRCRQRIMKYPYTTVNVFIPTKDTKPLVGSGGILNYDAAKPEIQCATTDPRIPVTLWFTDETGSMEEVKNVLYDPTNGFKLLDNRILNGTYICKSGGNDSVRFKERTSKINYKGFNINPKQLKMKCGDGDVALVIKGTIPVKKSGDIERVSTSNIRWVSIHRGEFIRIGSYVDAGKAPPLHVFCAKNDRIFDVKIKNRGRLMRKWKIDVDLVSDKSLEYFDSSIESYYVHEMGNVRKFSLLKWDSFPYDEYIFMLSEGERTLHTNTTSSFTCKTSRDSSDDLTFWMELNDGNVTQVFNDSSENAMISLENRTHFQFRTWTLDIQLPIEAVAILCKTPSDVHATFYLGAERRFKTKDLQSPIIKPEKNVYEFYVGQSNAKIACFAEGEPQPILYTWEKGLRKLHNDIGIHTRIGRNEESILVFESVNKSHAGTYFCNATNRIGTQKFLFTVNVEDNPADIIEQRNKIIMIVSIAIVGIIAAVVFGFGICRYYKAKAILRGLNEQEMKEFFQGRPELVKNVYDQPFAGDFDVLPYDTKFEIDSRDADLDYKSVLGKGEFGTVIKGCIKSRELPVAVKISKTADVTIFKTLLSEVKILSYIGYHENVAGLVGVNTTDIQNRNIYIYMDLCELGSLEKYLRANKLKFFNLIDENQQIKITKGPCLSERMSTLDLIRWAAQIAAGMEYLGYKSIVHADLAARNVLLTHDKKVRVTDFGMSKKLYECNFYQKKTRCPLPWRWMALESLKTLQFSVESDIWSYGVTLWEIFSLGDVPYPNEEWNKAFENMLMSGIRMGKPKFTTGEIYSKLVGCWDENPTNRPQFSNLRKYFTDHLSKISEHENSKEDSKPLIDFGDSKKPENVKRISIRRHSL